MNFGFNEEQELLRNTARKFFENECGSDTVRRLMETPEGIDAELWKKLAEQGWLGLIYPEPYDGMALGLVDLVVLMEEMGRAVAPGPYFSAVLLGGLAILEAGGDAQKKEWLPRIAAGDKRVALAWMEPSAQLGPAGVTLTAVEKGGKYTLSGTKLFVHDAHTADALVVAARTRPGAGADGVSLFLLPKGTKVEATLWFDNSANNAFNPDPTSEVRWGDQSWEEMAIGFFVVAFWFGLAFLFLTAWAIPALWRRIMR